jgi:hypothetical protein
MPFPDWADIQLSRDLPILRSRGENQDLEYKSSFPKNVSDLGKEIAAFATSNQGTILIGVSNDGDLVGLNEALTSDGRDGLLRRVEGICTGTIKPSITPTAKFAWEDDKVVLVLWIPKGSQPVYYSNKIPYVRHITEARPAEPHEVAELVKNWLVSTGIKIDELDPLGILISRLAPMIFDIIIYGEEADDRNINPWLDMWRAQFHQIASDIREISVQEISIKENLSDDLREIAEALDRVANMRLYIGCGKELTKLVIEVLEIAKKFKQTKIDPIPMSQDSLNNIRGIIASVDRKLKNLLDRSQGMIEHGRIEEFQSEASDIGHTLLKISYYNIDTLQNGLGQRLQQIGKKLHLVETMRIYMDGGRSIEAVTEHVMNQHQELETLVSKLP